MAGRRPPVSRRGPASGRSPARPARAPERQRDPGSRPASGEPPPGHVLLGEFGRAQGLGGELRLKSYTADPLAVAGYGPLVTAGGRTIVLERVRPAPGDQPDILVVRIAGVTDRTAAEALNRTRLFVPRDSLGEPDEDEFFVADLLGLDALDASGEPLGRVIGVPDYGGGQLLEIRPVSGGSSLLVPFTLAFVPVVDIAARRLVVEPPAEPSDDDEPA